MSLASLKTDPSVRPVFRLSRVFKAPRDLVWKAWTDAGHLQRWFTPAGARMTSCRLDLREGGLFHYGLCMPLPDGGEANYWGRWLIREISAPERLVFVVSFSDENAGITRNPWSSAWPLQTLSTVTFTDQGDKTLMQLEWTPLDESAAEREAFAAGTDSMNQGWTGTLDQLDAFLAKR